MRCAPLLLGALLPLGGCCSLSRLFCGPDKSPWVSVRFDTPEAAVATLLEAIRRDDPEVVYQTLHDRYRNRLGIDGVVAQLAWQKVRDATPGLHLAGYAAIPQPSAQSAERVVFDLDVEGRRVQVVVEPSRTWTVRYRLADGTVLEKGQAVADWERFVALVDEDDDERARLSLGPFRFHRGERPLPLAAIEQAGIQQRWLIADLRTAD